MTPRPENDPSLPGWRLRDRPQPADRPYSSSRTATAPERSLPLLQAETGAALERQLLLAEGPGDEAEIRRPAGTRRGGRLILGTLLAIIAATATVSFIRERKQWEEKVSSMESRISQMAVETTQRVDTLRREAVEKDQVLAERKADNQKLAALMEKTLVELKTSLEGLRREERERNEKTNEALEKAIAKASVPRQPTLAEATRSLLSRWLPTTPQEQASHD